MATSVSVVAPGLVVEPGQSVSTELRVRNTGEVVDQFSFQPLGEAADWLTVEPPLVRLFPDTDEVVTVTIAPPREPSSRPGVSTWAVKATPQEDPDGAAVGEGTVDVGEFVEMSAELQPINGRGRLTGKFDIAVDNRGNVPVPVRILGSDTEQVLGFDFSPHALETAPGSAHFTKLSIKPPTRIWRGTPKTYPFQLVVEPQARANGVTGNGDAPLPVAPALDDAIADTGSALAVAVAAPPVAAPLAAPPIVLTGNFVQEAIIPKWLWKAVLAAVALLLALWILWKTLLKPEVESAARAVASEEVAEVAEEVETLSTEVAQAEQQAAAAQETADEAAAAAGAGGGASPTTAPGGGGSATTVPDGSAGDGASGPVIGPNAVPTSFRIVATAEAGTDGSSANPPNPDGTTTAITDIVLQNPGGDIGFIRVLVNGEVIIEAALQSFPTQDFHYVAPYLVEPGQTAGVEVTCAADQIVAGDPCSAAVSFAGYNTTEAEG